MAAGDEADLLIGCRMMTSDKKLIRYDDDSSYMDEFRVGAGLCFKPTPKKYLVYHWACGSEFEDNGRWKEGNDEYGI